MNTDHFSWIGVTNLSFSPKDEEGLFNFALSQGVQNIGIFKIHEIDNYFIRTLEEAKNVAYELGIPLPEYTFKLEHLSPAIAARQIMRELNIIWSQTYNEYHLKCKLYSIAHYFERRMKKVLSFHYRQEGDKEIRFKDSMSLDIADDIYVYYLIGENIGDYKITNEKINSTNEIGKIERLKGEGKHLGEFLIMRDLSAVYCFYRYIHRLFQEKYQSPLNIKKGRASFSSIFKDFCNNGFVREHKRLFKRNITINGKQTLWMDPSMHPKVLENSILYS